MTMLSTTSNHVPYSLHLLVQHAATAMLPHASPTMRMRITLLHPLAMAISLCQLSLRWYQVTPLKVSCSRSIMACTVQRQRKWISFSYAQNKKQLGQHRKMRRAAMILTMRIIGRSIILVPVHVPLHKRIAVQPPPKKLKNNKQIPMTCTA